MNNKPNETNKLDDQETFLRIFYNVKRCKGMDWEEKVILSNYISFQIRGDEFYQTDAYQASGLGLSPAQISKYTSRLKERGEIDTKMTYVENPNGGRPIPKRYVTVLDMDKWVKGETIPVVKKIISATQKKKAKKMAEVNTAPSGDTKDMVIESIQPKKEIEVVTVLPKAPVKTTTSTVPDSKTLESWILLTDQEDLSPISKKELKDGIRGGKVLSEKHLNVLFAKMKQMDLAEGL